MVWVVGGEFMRVVHYFFVYMQVHFENTDFFFW